MEVFHSPDKVRRFTSNLRSAGKSVGLVPTMGALHQGHLSLIRQSGSCDATIATIFINPTQFGPNEDLARYPRTLEQDYELLGGAGVDAVFVPDNEQMYPNGYSTYVDPPEVGQSLEGICRPGHFRGVSTVVMKLFQAIPATHAYFGKKDFQQYRVIEAMVRDLNIGIQIVGCETIREPDGLALSSRNRYLSPIERSRALQISKALELTASSVLDGEDRVDVLQTQMRQTLQGIHTSKIDAPDDLDDLQQEKAERAGLNKIDYAVIVDSETLAPLTKVDRPAVALIAGFVGQTRLIDNRELARV